MGNNNKPSGNFNRRVCLFYWDVILSRLDHPFCSQEINDCGLQGFSVHVPDVGAAYDFPVPGQEQDVRAPTNIVVECIPEGLSLRVIDIKIYEFDDFPIFIFEPMHDGRHRLADVSPKGEKFDNFRFAAVQKIDRLYIAGLQTRGA